MTILTEAPRPGEAIISEPENHRGRDAITVALNQTLVANQIIGRSAFAATVAFAIGAGNTGNGVLTLAATPFTGVADVGVYRVVMTEPVANLGTFLVEGPTGVIVGRGVVGTAYSGGVAFTIADGATDFVAGDSFLVTVSAVTYRWGAFDPAATDGRQVPRALLYGAVTTGASVTVPGVAFVRGCQFNSQKLQWLTGLTTQQRTDAIALLNAQFNGNVVR